jgi:hypothetical protein
MAVLKSPRNQKKKNIWRLKIALRVKNFSLRSHKILVCGKPITDSQTLYKNKLNLLSFILKPR